MVEGVKEYEDFKEARVLKDYEHGYVLGDYCCTFSIVSEFYYNCMTYCEFLFIGQNEWMTILNSLPNLSISVQ